ncbi:type II toxin-antitoxin system RelE/ParE family toxin [Rhizobium beringeri]|uniref:type II toxin-antitoxin system RelE/ParE family toxin n=1 Tax=Rhizobium TaxID=379 RepID=UPI001C943AEC|nr:type II toxin-antitoxin system RelE/ParE family toxin [Rhizobium leguminosarum]MBY5455496.1 plasmid maintenance system killer [Rhizobium leguminosarum]
MIKSFRNKALADLFETGKTAKIDAKLQKPILIRLDRLEQAEKPDDMNLPGFDFHALKGNNPTRYTVHVNGPWCITFEFDGNDAARVDFEQYH